MLDFFIDSKGNKWKASSLIEAAKDLEIINFDLRKVNNKLKLYWNLNCIIDYISHYKRIKKANLNIPIILNSKGAVMDGWHRIIKAKIQGLIYLPAKQFKQDPKPDIVLNAD